MAAQSAASQPRPAGEPSCTDNITVNKMGSVLLHVALQGARQGLRSLNPIKQAVLCLASEEDAFPGRQQTVPKKPSDVAGSQAGPPEKQPGIRVSQACFWFDASLWIPTTRTRQHCLKQRSTPPAGGGSSRSRSLSPMHWLCQLEARCLTRPGPGTSLQRRELTKASQQPVGDGGRERKFPPLSIKHGT